MQASCTPNMKVSTQILRTINCVHLANQTGGILHNPPTPRQGGSSSSTLVMTTSLMKNWSWIRNMHTQHSQLLCDKLPWLIQRYLNIISWTRPGDIVEVTAHFRISLSCYYGLLLLLFSIILKLRYCNIVCLLASKFTHYRVFFQRSTFPA